MKKIIFTLALTLFLTISSKAQSNLEFFRAVKQKYSFNDNEALNTTLIVPTGKALKITSASALSTSGSYFRSVFIDDQCIVREGSTVTLLPLWLPAGTYSIRVSTMFDAGFFSFSGIEFNIVP